MTAVSNSRLPRADAYVRVHLSHRPTDVIGVVAGVRSPERQGDEVVDDRLRAREIFLAIALRGPVRRVRERRRRGTVSLAGLTVLARVVAVRAGGLVAVDVQRVEPLAELFGDLNARQSQVDLERGVAGRIGHAADRQAPQLLNPIDDAPVQPTAVFA